MSSTLVLGCGYTGEVLVRKLAERGDAVTATTRTGDKVGAIAALSAQPAVWRAPDPRPEGRFDVAFVLFPPDGIDPELAAAAVEGIPTIVYCSSTGVYGSGDVDEDTPPAPSGDTGTARLAAEEAFRRRGAVAVRAAGIYGPGRNAVERHRAGRLQSSGDLDRPVNLVHVDDLAATLLAAADRGRPGQVFIACDGRPVAWRDLLALCELVTGRPVPHGEPGPSAHATGGWRRCSNRRMREVLGVTPRWPDALDALATLYGVRIDKVTAGP